jgi:Putative Flp pilus-assembly TadE/G-like
MLRARGAEERGSVAITVVLSMTVLLGFAALVVDIGLNWAARTSAQTAADSAALAGASVLVTDGGAAAVLAVVEYLDDNVDGLADPGNLAWVTNASESDGNIVCWTLPGPPPGPGAGCPDGSNALQVTTPPIQVQYAFAPVLGKTSNSIRARAAAGAGPAAPNNCVLCLLDPTAPRALENLGFGDVTVNGGGIAVNSSNLLALVVAGAGDISAEQIRVIGGLSNPPGGGNLFPPAEFGGPPVPDPLADLPTPDLLGSPPIPRDPDPIVVNTNQTLPPGIYNTVRVEGTATLTLQTGVFVFTGLDGLTVADDARVVSSAGGATIYLACSGYPSPCSGNGARFRVQDDGRFQANPLNSGAYAGLSIFAARGNTRTMRFQSDRNVTLPGVLYGPSTRVSMENNGDLQVNGLMVVRALSLTTVTGPDASVTVNYDPSDLLPGVGPPVLIR